MILTDIEVSSVLDKMMFIISSKLFLFVEICGKLSITPITRYATNLIEGTSSFDATVTVEEIMKLYLLLRRDKKTHNVKLTKHVSETTQTMRA